MSEAGAGPPTGPEPRGAVRLTFQYEGDEVRLLSSQRIQKVLPPEEAVEEERQGFFVEVRGADDRVLERRALPDPVRRDAEVFSDEEDRSLSRVPVERPAGVFSLVVPDLEEADYVALVERRAQDRPGLAAVPNELTRVPLRGQGSGGRS